MKLLKLKAGKERSLARRHPWVFESAIAKGSGDAGETVRIESHEGKFLAWAACSPASQIRARAWSFDETQRIDAAFFHARVASAVNARALFDLQSDGVRLIHGEADGLPGLIVDRYGAGENAVLVAQFLSAGVERWKAVLADALLAATGLTRLYERSDASGREREGLPKVTGWLRGAPPEGTSAPTDITIREHDWPPPARLPRSCRGTAARAVARAASSVRSPHPAMHVTRTAVHPGRACRLRSAPDRARH